MPLTADVAISSWLSRNTGRSFASAPAAEVAGGSVYRCVRWASESSDAFVKLATADRLTALEAEAAGLQALADADLKTKDIDQVVLVGGATRMPMVQALSEAGSAFTGLPIVAGGTDPLIVPMFGEDIESEEILALDAALGILLRDQGIYRTTCRPQV